jgi:hypothetical protein
VIVALVVHVVVEANVLKSSVSVEQDDYYDDDDEVEGEEEYEENMGVKGEGEIEVVDEAFERFKKIASLHYTHYSIDLYKGFSIEKALAEWQQQTISINYYDPMRGRLYVSGEVNLWERPISHIVHELCSVLVDDTLKAADNTAWMRCSVPATQTVRMRTIKLIANISQWYEYAPFEEEIFAYLHAYQAPVIRPGMTAAESLTSPLAGRACLLGSPSPHLLLSILGGGFVREVIVFSRPYKSSSSAEVPPREIIWDNTDASKAAKLFNVSLTMLPYSTLLEEYWKYRNSDGNNGKQASNYAHICDFIHISADIFPSTLGSVGKDDYTESIVPLMKFLSQRYPRLQPINSKQGDSYLYIARVIWQNKNQQLIKNSKMPVPGSKYINWKFSSTWFDLTFVGNVIDRNGFIEKSFGTWQQKVPFRFSTVEIGYFKTPDELLKESPVDILGNGVNIDPPPTPEDKDFMVIMITATYRLLVENVFALQTQLNELGYRNVILSAEMTIQNYESIEAVAQKINAKIVHIVLCPMDLTLFAKNNVIYNSEPINSLIMFNDGEARFRYLYSRTLQMWHFRAADNTVDVLKGFESHETNSAHKKLHIVPFAYPSSRLDILKSMNISITAIEPFSDHSIRLFPDSLRVVFFGGCSDRRADFIDNLRAQLVIRQTEKKRRKINFLNFCGYYTFDYERDYYLVNADVVINVNTLNDSSLETHRINHLLSLGKVIVSEEGSSSELADTYRSGVIFVEGSQEMAKVLGELADDKKALQVAHRNALTLHNILKDQSVQFLSDAMIQLHYALFGR